MEVSLFLERTKSNNILPFKGFDTQDIHKETTLRWVPDTFIGGLRRRNLNPPPFLLIIFVLRVRWTTRYLLFKETEI